MAISDDFPPEFFVDLSLEPGQVEDMLEGIGDKIESGDLSGLTELTDFIHLMVTAPSMPYSQSEGFGLSEEGGVKRVDGAPADQVQAPTDQELFGAGTPAPTSYVPVPGGEGTTEPFLMVLTDRKWSYNNAYVSTDAALLHYLEHCEEPRDLDERLMEATGDPSPYSFIAVDGPANSQTEWWANVSEASKDIPESRHFEGMYY